MSTTETSDQQLPLDGVPAPITTEKSPDQVCDVLEKLSKKGKLPGFERGGKEGVFSVEAQGTPFDRSLIAEASTADGQTTLTWRLKTHPKWPVGIAIVLILTVWPGLPITDSLLQTYFPGSYGVWTSGWFQTWMWYLPVTVIPIPWFWRSTFKKVNTSTFDHASETRNKIRDAIGGRDG